MAAFGGDEGTTVSLSQVSAAAQKVIQARTGDGHLGEIDKSASDGETVYDVELTAKDGQARDFTVAEDGTLLSTQITLAEIPLAVQRSIKTLAKDGEVASIDESLDDTEPTYDIALTAKDGSEKGLVLDADGALLSMTVSLSQTPAEVQKTIHTEVADGQVKRVEKMYDADGVTYDVEAIAKGGRAASFAVAESGKLVSRQVTLAETPAAVRKAIRRQVGDGTVLRVDQSFVREKGVLPYEVQARKNGKPFDFSVGPHGRFLGVDD